MCEILVRAVDNAHEDRDKDMFSYKRGYPVVVMDDGHVWGREERPPNFYIVKLPGVKKEEMQYCTSVVFQDEGTENERIIGRRKWKVDDTRIPPTELSDIETKGEVEFGSRASFENTLVRIDGGI